MAINGVVGGDSMASNDRPGVPLGEGVSGYLQSTNPGSTWNAFSQGGLQLQGMIDQFVSQIHDVYYSPGDTNVYVPFSLLHGNVQDTEETPEQTMALYIELQQIAQGLGWLTFALTIPGTTEFNDPNNGRYRRPERQEVNEMVVAGFADSNYIVDIDQIPGLCTLCVPDSGDADPVYFLNDTPMWGAIHLTPYSNSLIAAAITAQLNAERSPVATPTRLFGPAQLGNTAATRYTCPGSTIAVMKRMRVSNPTGAPVNFTLSIGNDAAGTRLYDGVVVPAGGALDIYGPFTLAAGNIVQAYGSTNNALVLEIDGTEQPE